MADPKPIPYASADPVADLLAEEYGIDPDQAADMSRRIKSKQMPDTYNATGEAMDRTGKNEIKRMDTLVANAKRYAALKQRRDAGQPLQPDEEDFFKRVRGAALQKMANQAQEPRSAQTEQMVNSLRPQGFGAKGVREDPNDGVFQAMDAANTGFDRAKQLQAQAGTFRTLAGGRVPNGAGAEAAVDGMGGGMAGGMQGAGAPNWPMASGSPGADGGEANYEEPPRYMGGGTRAPAPQLDIGALLRKRWEEEQLRALLASGVPQ